jgi:hypothetical protein
MSSLKPDVKLIKIFLGGKSGNSRASFTNALGVIRAKHDDRVRVEILDTDMMKRDPYRYILF